MGMLGVTAFIIDNTNVQKVVNDKEREREKEQGEASRSTACFSGLGSLYLQTHWYMLPLQLHYHRYK